MEVDAGPAGTAAATAAAAPAAAGSFSELLQQGLSPVLEELFDAPSTELDKHITAIEVAAAAAAAAAKWQDAACRNTLWEILCPLMVRYITLNPKP